MFDIYNKDNHVSYSEWLKPDADYKLEFGVCCTYSLDLEAVLGTMLSLGLNAELGTDYTNNPEALLKGVLEYSNKLVFFCSDCEIKSFSSKIDKFTKLSNLLDNAIFEVKPESGGIFHPKLWFLHYTPINQSEDLPPYVRLLILTKNLTFDQSLDFGIFMEAYTRKDNNQLKENEPLVAMLDYLKRHMTKRQREGNPTDNIKNRLQKFEELIDAFQHADEFEFDNTWDFEINDEENDSPKCKFSECEFIPIGINKNLEEKLDVLLKKDAPRESQTEKDWFICISPFLSEDIVGKMAAKVKSGKEGKKSCGSAILTRKEDLIQKESVASTVFNRFDRCFCVKTGYRNYVCNENDNSASTDADDNQREKNGYSIQGDIHAKMYFVGSGSDVYFYTGSANATHNSFFNNVEFLVRLKYKNNRPDYDEHRYLLNLLTEEDKIENLSALPFELITKEDLSEKDIQKEENYKDFLKLRNLLDCIKARVEKSPENEYSVSFEEIDSFFNGSGITIALNGRSTKCAPLQSGACIDGVKSTELSEFYIIDIPEDNSLNLPPKTFVKIIPTDGIPDARDVDVMNSIIDAPDKLYRLFDMFISHRPLSVLVKNMRMFQQSGKKASSSSRSVNFSGIYEQLLQLAVEDPQRIIEFYNSGFAKLNEAKKDEFQNMIEAFYAAVTESNK